MRHAYCFLKLLFFSFLCLFMFIFTHYLKCQIFVAYCTEVYWHALAITSEQVKLIKVYNYSQLHEDSTETFYFLFALSMLLYCVYVCVHFPFYFWNPSISFHYSCLLSCPTSIEIVWFNFVSSFYYLFYPYVYKSWMK
jgi:hypothetical protein